MAEPIAKARHVARRTRRRGASPRFRAALVSALVLTSALAIVAGRSAMIQNGAQGSAPVATPIIVDGVAAGACMSFPPTGHSNGKAVFLDPGHGGLDPGVEGAAGGREGPERAGALAGSPRPAAMLGGE